MKSSVAWYYLTMGILKKIFFLLFILALAGGGFYLWKIKPKVTPVTYKTVEESDKYVRFEMEVYDKISSTYWMKSTETDLSTLFKLSLEKVTNTPVTVASTTRQGTATMIAKAFSLATSTEMRKQLAVNTAMVALYNIAPAGRNQLLSQKQETAFRNEVANINPAKDLYSDLGVAKDASPKEVETAYKKQVATLQNATSSEDKAKLEKVKYSHSVLVNPDSKAIYDTTKAEPTVSKNIIGSTLYIDMRKISPTTLIEFAKTVDNASTTKGLSSMIIDFRGNVGGSLDFLTNFFGLFVGKDQYVFDFFQQGNYLPQRTVQPKYPELDRYKEVAILVDNMTQSTAELTTATFKRFHMAHVVGKTTRGWGTIENTYPIETEIDPTEKYVLLLVNSITIREDGQPIEGRGVEPDVDIGKPSWKSDLPKFFKSDSLVSAIKQVVGK